MDVCCCCAAGRVSGSPKRQRGEGFTAESAESRRARQEKKRHWSSLVLPLRLSALSAVNPSLAGASGFRIPALSCYGKFGAGSRLGGGGSFNLPLLAGGAGGRRVGFSPVFGAGGGGAGASRFGGFVAGTGGNNTGASGS